jgi:endonuclease YncB( thermonuclease family)
MMAAELSSTLKSRVWATCNFRLIRLALAGAAAAALLTGCLNETSASPPPGPYIVAEVHDGDSFNLTAKRGERVRVRIAGIDAPEREQPYGQQSKRSLEAMLRSGEIELDAIKKDRFDRWVANVSIQGQDLGLMQIASGHAWFFRRYQDDLSASMRRQYDQAEADARRDFKGLWVGLRAASSNPALAPEPPWLYRERTRKSR